MTRWLILIAVELAALTSWIVYHWFFCETCRVADRPTRHVLEVKVAP